MDLNNNLIEIEEELEDNNSQQDQQPKNKDNNSQQDQQPKNDKCKTQDLNKQYQSEKNIPKEQIDQGKIVQKGQGQQMNFFLKSQDEFQSNSINDDVDEQIVISIFYNCSDEEINYSFSEESKELNKKQYIQDQNKENQKVRQIKEINQDDTIDFIQKIQSISNLEQLEQMLTYLSKLLVTLEQKSTEFLRSKTEDIENKIKFNLDPFSKRKFKAVNNNKYNIICQYLIKQKKENSYPILLNCFIEYRLKWINLLDFKQKGNQKLFDQIKEFLNRDIIKKNLDNNIYNYFINNKQFTKNLLFACQQLSYNMEYLQQLYQFIQQINQLKINRYYQKRQINFCQDTFQKLIDNDAYDELTDAIELSINQPKQFIIDPILSQNKDHLKKFVKAMKKLRQKQRQKYI